MYILHLLPQQFGQEGPCKKAAHLVMRACSHLLFNNCWHDCWCVLFICRSRLTKCMVCRTMSMVTPGSCPGTGTMPLRAR